MGSDADEDREGPPLHDWGGGDPASPDSWRWIVANWPHGRWAEWRRRATELLPGGATAAAIVRRQRAAYEAMVRGD